MGNPKRKLFAEHNNYFYLKCSFKDIIRLFALIFKWFCFLYADRERG